MKILVVDDNPSSLKLLCAQLESEGHSAIRASDGSEALKLLESQLVDAIISDVFMSKMDGYRLCEEIRKNEGLCHIPFIIYTSTFNSPADEKIALEMGADKYLQKPGAVTDIIAALRGAIVMKRGSRPRPLSPTQELERYKLHRESLATKIARDKKERRALQSELIERQVAYGLLSESEEKFRQLADNIDDVFWITSPDLKTILYVSAAYETVWGRSIESLHADPHEWLEAILLEERERVVATFASCGGNDSSVNVEYRITRPDGTIHWVHDRRYLVEGAAGNVIRLIGISSDVTERRQTEEELRASRGQLRVLAGRIQAAREEERSHAAREIHDVLAQELTALKIDIAWLSRRLAGGKGTWNQDKLREKVAAMRGCVDNAGLSVQRIAATLRPLVLDSLGLCAAIEWIASDFQQRTRIPCHVFVPPENPSFDGASSIALFRILQESLTNIIRHANATRVRIHLSVKAKSVILSVDDNGRGIQPEESGDFQSIGLLGMRERASLLGGKCTIAAGMVSGTRVEVRLPITKVSRD